jgi:lysozyme
MDISQRGIDFIVGFEGKKTLLPDGRYKSYLDTLAKPPVWTVWAGLTKGVGRDTCWTEAQCESQFAKELAIYEDAVEKNVTVPLNQNQFDALTSFVYNCGPGALRGSTLLKLLNQGNYQGAAAQFARWNKAGGKVWPGLVRRRAAEASLFLEPVDEQPIEIGVKVGDEIVAVPSDAMPQRVEESQGSIKETISQSWTIRGAISAAGGAFMSIYSWLVSGAQEAGKEAVALKTTFGPWEALFSVLKTNMSLLAAGFVLAGCGIVVARRLNAAREGRVG